MTALEVAMGLATANSMIVLAHSPAHKSPSQTVLYKAKEAEKKMEDGGKSLAGVFTVHQTCMCYHFGCFCMVGSYDACFAV